jgi:cyclopropane fatty-acyl-phospholipid synthase-like methyltransferase
MLFSLDNINHLKDENHEKFLNFITDISSPQVKILFTSIKFSTKEFPEDYVVKKI